MDRDRFIFIFKNTPSCWDGDNCLKGLVIISKYTDTSVHGASKDILYSECIDKLIDAGITEEDVVSIAKLNWGIEDGEYLYCFV